VAIGSYMGKTFTVSDKKIFAPASFTGSIGTEYAEHKRPLKKPTSQYLSPKADTYSEELLLRAQDGVNPRAMRDFFKKACEQGKADYFIIGSKPICNNQLVITDISEDWQSVVVNGALIECKLTLSLKEYV